MWQYWESVSPWVFSGSLLIFGFIAWCLNIVSLPGNWILVALIGLYCWLGPSDSAIDLGWPTFLLSCGLAGVGELLEMLASMAGARRAGGSRKAGTLAMIGSMIGSLVGASLCSWIPFVGIIIGAILFACLGAMAGALLGERLNGKPLGESMPVGTAAFWGRLLGMAGKIACGMAILAIVIVGLFR